MKKIVSLILVLTLVLCTVSALADIKVKASNGTVTVKVTKACKISVKKGGEQYYIDVPKGTSILPLPYGTGKYSVTEYFHVSGKTWKEGKRATCKYAGDPEETFRHPSAVVNFDDSSLAVKKASELCVGLSSEKEKAQAIWAWVTTHFVYDYVRAAEVVKTNAARTMVNIDDVFTKKLGICYDLSVMAVAMLRSQGMAARLEIGSGHAWLKVSIDGTYALMDIGTKLQTGKGKAAGLDYKAEEVF